MRIEEIKNEIDKLELDERLLLVEDVWDSIAKSSLELPVPEWQKRELDRRYEEYKDGKQCVHDWKSVHKELRNTGV
ncbi:MAG: addiction module protein [Desulfobacterales bacterium]|nr:addiction module protein [Desulfobacterales bacterium]